MSKTLNENLGFRSLHVLGFHFSGVFQLRLPTDADPSDHPRGQNGWTFAYGDEANLDRVIRFNNPVSPRSFAPEVGVYVTNAFIDDQTLDDSIVREPVNLGSQSYFDGSNGADGREPIINFELHLGGNEDYLFCLPREPPVGQGTFPTTFQIPKLDILLTSRRQSLESSSNPIDQERLKNISRSLNLAYEFQVTYQSVFDNITFNPHNSVLIKTMQEKQIDNLSFTTNFYGYDGDALEGYVNGEISGVFR